MMYIHIIIYNFFFLLITCIYCMYVYVYVCNIIIIGNII